MGTSPITLWTFRIECDECKAVLGITMHTREQTLAFVYEAGWRVNSRARKYFHLCYKCAYRGCPSGS